jgi:hypothetical protein
MASSPPEPARTIGELCFAGDWACAHGDLAALRHLALELAVRAREPLHCALIELADACAYDPDRAVMRWSELKGQIFGSRAP